MNEIDFATSPFDSSSQRSPPARVRWELYVLVIVALGVVGVGVATFTTRLSSKSPFGAGPTEHPLPMVSQAGGNLTKQEFMVPMHADERGDLPNAQSVSLVSPLPDGSVAVRSAECTGDEALCTVATSQRPVEMLRKLIAAIPVMSARSYRIRLSVTPIEEPAKTADDDPQAAQ